jgi:hypothetical protein
MQLRRGTIGLLVAVGAILLWLNLRTPVWLAEYHIRPNRPPENVDLITRFLFFRGWPWTPCLYCAGGLSTWDPDVYVQLAAWGDVLVLVLTLAMSCVAAEWLGGRWRPPRANVLPKSG